MNNRTTAYVQAVRGPVLLVTIGVLFAIHQAGVLSFGQTWPLLIIVIGVMKLLEWMGGPAAPWVGAQGAAYGPRQSHQTGPNVPPPPGAGRRNI